MQIEYTAEAALSGGCGFYAREESGVLSPRMEDYDTGDWHLTGELTQDGHLGLTHPGLLYLHVDLLHLSLHLSLSLSLHVGLLHLLGLGLLHLLDMLHLSLLHLGLGLHLVGLHLGLLHLGLGLHLGRCYLIDIRWEVGGRSGYRRDKSGRERERGGTSNKFL